MDKNEWIQLLLDSYERLLGKELIPRLGSREEQTEKLDLAPFVVVSHGTEANPIFNYGNLLALSLWELTLEELLTTPSRETVRGDEIGAGAREELLKQVREKGYIDNYRGVRVTKTGKRFRIDRAVVWNIVDNEGIYRGQAATFPEWEFILPP